MLFTFYIITWYGHWLPIITHYNDIVFPFGIDPDTGDYGYYKAGADTVTPFKSGDVPPTTSYVIPYGGNNISIRPKQGTLVCIACSAVAVPVAGGTSANINITAIGLSDVTNQFSNISGSNVGMKIELLLGIASSSTVAFNMTSNYNHIGVIYYTPASW